MASGIPNTKGGLCAVVESPVCLDDLAQGGPEALTGLVTSTVPAAVASRERGLGFRHLDLWKDLGDAPANNRLTKRLATGWKTDPDTVRLCPWLEDFRGLRVGLCLEMVFSHVICAAASALRIAGRFLADRRPEAILAGRGIEPRGDFWSGFFVDPKRRALLAAARAQGVQVRELGPRDLPVQAPPVTAWGPQPGPEKKQRVGQGGILFFSQGRHGVQLDHLFSLAQAQHPGDMSILSQDLAAETQTALDELGCTVLDPWPLLGLQARRQVSEAVQAARERREDILAAVESFFRRHDPFGGLLFPLTRFQYEWFLDQGLAEVLTRAALAQDCLDALKPRLFMTMIDSTYSDICWLETARARGIPSLCVLHGTLYQHPEPDFWSASHSDVCAVWGPLTQEWFREYGSDPARHPLTGHPRFDGLRERLAAMDPAPCAQRLGLDRSRPVVALLLTMCGGGMDQMFTNPVMILDALMAGLADIPGVQVLVRGHPTIPLEHLAAAAPRRGMTCLIDPQVSLHELLRVSDLALVQPSSVLHDAMLAGVPTVLLGVMTAEPLLWWKGRPGLVTLENPARIASLARDLLPGGPGRQAHLAAQEAFTEAMLGPLDGQISKRILDVAEAMAPLGAVKPGL